MIGSWRTLWLQTGLVGADPLRIFALKKTPTNYQLGQRETGQRYLCLETVMSNIQTVQISSCLLVQLFVCGQINSWIDRRSRCLPQKFLVVGLRIVGEVRDEVLTEEQKQVTTLIHDESPLTFDPKFTWA